MVRDAVIGAAGTADAVRQRAAIEAMGPRLVDEGHKAGETGAGASGTKLDYVTLPGAPRVIFDLPMPCHKPGCGVQLGALSYHAFVNDSRFMLWIEGVCPRCMERRKTIFDPMVGMQAAAKEESELDALMASIRADIMPERDEEVA